MLKSPVVELILLPLITREIVSSKFNGNSFVFFLINIFQK